MQSIYEKTNVAGYFGSGVGSVEYIPALARELGENGEAGDAHETMYVALPCDSGKYGNSPHIIITTNADPVCIGWIEDGRFFPASPEVEVSEWLASAAGVWAKIILENIE